MKSVLLTLLLLPILLLSSCGSWYQATLNSRGVSPEYKSFYITSSDSSLVKTLEFKEYATVLKNRLNEIGYTESLPNDAALAIVLDYQLGDTYLAGTTVGSYSYNTANINTAIKSTTTAIAKANTKVGNNKITTTASRKSSTNGSIKTTGYSAGYTTTSATNTYKIPLLVVISAVDNNSKETYWEVIVKDDLYRETQMQSVMPWLILSAQPYFGRGSQGEVTTKIDNTKANKEKYNLIWPY